MNTKKFFDTKEQYLAFRAAFAAAQNSPRAKRTAVPCDEYKYVAADGSKICYPTLHKGTGRARKDGWLTGAHFVLYNIIRGKDYRSGFTIRRNKVALQNAYAPNAALYYAVWKLNSAIGYAKEYLDADTKEIKLWFKFKNEAEKEEMLAKARADIKKRALERVQEFLEPFNGTLTFDQFASIECPSVEAMYPLTEKFIEFLNSGVELNWDEAERVWKESLRA